MVLCHEVKRVKQKGDETIPNNAVKQKGGEIPEKLTQTTTEQINSRGRINVQPCKDSP